MTRSMLPVLTALLGPGSAANAPAARLANPASELCVAHGAKIEVETDANGAQRGTCVFPDGTRISEWTYFRNKNRPTK